MFLDLYVDIWIYIKQKILSCLGQGLRSGSQNCDEKQKIHHFLEIVQYTCNTTFLYQNLMGDPNKQKKCKFASILAATRVLL